MCPLYYHQQQQSTDSPTCLYFHFHVHAKYKLVGGLVGSIVVLSPINIWHFLNYFFLHLLKVVLLFTKEQQEYRTDRTIVLKLNMNEPRKSAQLFRFYRPLYNIDMPFPCTLVSLLGISPLFSKLCIIVTNYAIVESFVPQTIFC